MSYERRLGTLALLAGLPGTVTALALLWAGGTSLKLKLTLTLLLALAWLFAASSLHQQVVHPLRTLANLLEALREGDYSLRARRTHRQDAMGDVLWEVNRLQNTLQKERLGAREATALLFRVMEEIEVAVFTFDETRRLRLVNRAGERLLGKDSRHLLGRGAEELDLGPCLEGEPTRLFQAEFPGGQGRWGLRRRTFREGGLPHQLLVITDLSQTLREEERQAWRRLIRVIGHELNNSLTPIRSMTATLVSLLGRSPPPDDLEEDLARGLRVIGERTESLVRFMADYARLARLPPPRLRPLELAPLVRRVAALETRLPVEIQPGPEIEMEADGDQLEQLLINLIRNAADAALETGGGVRVGWNCHRRQLVVTIEDEGPGLSSTDNLFVPFYSTKPGGSGIGLVLALQIAEAHGGTLVLENRRSGRGCEARLHLPLRGGHTGGGHPQQLKLPSKA